MSSRDLNEMEGFAEPTWREVALAVVLSPVMLLATAYAVVRRVLD